MFFGMEIASIVGETLDCEIQITDSTIFHEGELITVTMTITNTGSTQVKSVEPSLEVKNVIGDASAELYGPNPESQDIPAGDSRKFTWKYTARSGNTGGIIRFEGYASGTDEVTGNLITSIKCTSEDVGVAAADNTSLEESGALNPNAQVCALSYNNIEKARKYSDDINEILEEIGRYKEELCDEQQKEVESAEGKAKEAEESFKKAEEAYRSRNCIAANNNALKAINELEECLSILRVTGVKAKIHFDKLIVKQNKCSFQQNLFVEITYRKDASVPKHYFWVNNIFKIWWDVAEKEWRGLHEAFIYYVEPYEQDYVIVPDRVFRNSKFISLGKKKDAPETEGIELQTYLKKGEDTIFIVISGPEGKEEKDCARYYSEIRGKCLRARIITNSKDTYAIGRFTNEKIINQEDIPLRSDCSTRPEIELTGYDKKSTATFNDGTSGKIQIWISAAKLDVDPSELEKAWRSPTNIKVIDGIETKPQAKHKANCLEWKVEKEKMSFSYGITKNDYGISFY